MFLGFTATCYIEGEEGKEGEGVDAIFWSAVFAVYRPLEKVRFLSRGGKPVLEALARQIIADDVENTYVAMDADYDRYFAELIEDSRVVYTLGYSIENDLFSAESLFEIFKSLAHVIEVPQNVADFLTEELSRLERELKLGVCSDILALKAKTSVIPRASPGRMVRFDPATDRFAVDRGEFRKLCGAANVRTRPRADVKLNGSFAVCELCVGHLFRHVASIIVKSALTLFGRRSNYSQEHIRDVALNVFPTILAGEGRVSEHYRHAA